MKNTAIILLLFYMCNFNSIAQDIIVPLWKNVPNQKKSNEKEITRIDEIIRISNVQEPEIHVFLAKNINSKKAIIICPGGGYGRLAFNHEGTNFAEWLSSKGINAAVLKYRLPNSLSIITPHLVPLQDAQRAIRILRHNSTQWGINNEDIGVIGFSAGGHLASTLGTHFNYKAYEPIDAIDLLSAKPNYMALIYPVISMDDAITHKWSKKNLLGNDPSNELIELFSNEKHVTAETPRTFIVHSTDDVTVPFENSLLLFKALNEQKIETEFHIFPLGGHGYGFAKGKKQLENWPTIFYNWLQNLNE